MQETKSQRPGDFNGDGFADVALGASRAGEGGLVRVLFGTGEGFSANGELLEVESPQAGALFGAAVSAGDFDADGFSDLAVGAPGEDVAGRIDAGAIYVFYGSTDGLSQGAVGRWTMEQLTPNGAEQSAALGYELQSGNLGYGLESDLVAATMQRVDDAVVAGSIAVLFGSRTGLRDDALQLWSQASSGIKERPEPHDQFGVALATGNLGGDAYDDVAVGSYESVKGVRVAGAINVLYGGSEGLSAEASVLVTQRTRGVATRPRPYDQFGIELAAGDFNDDGWDDLAAGAPGESVRRRAYAGAVYVLFGSSEGVSGRQSQRWTQATPGVIDRPEEDDLFGQTLSTNRFDGEPGDDLAVGSFEAVGAHPNAGAVHVIYGSTTGLDAMGSQMITEAARGVAGRPGDDNFFGWSLASGDVDASGFAELIVGVPGDEYAGEHNVGTVRLFVSAFDGISTLKSDRTDGREGTDGEWGGGIGREIASETS